MSAEQWLRHLAVAIGVPEPTAEERDALLALAGVAAHSSERIAAPLSTWMAGRAALPVIEVRRVVEELGRAGETEED